MPGIATIPAYFKEGYTSQFIGFLLSILIAFVLGAVLTYIVGFKEEVSEDQETASETESRPQTQAPSSNSAEPLEINAVAAGIVIPVTEVKDEVFASKGMGDGIGIIAEEGKVYAPFDGTVEAVFPTGHAVGLSAGDTELLIHIGINTVELNGKGFQAHAAQGDQVKRGDLLVTFDKDMIEKEGYDTTVICVVTEPGEGRVLEIGPGGRADITEKVMHIE